MLEDIQSIMSEAPGGVRPDETIPDGFGVVDIGHTASDAGMVAHRGTLHPDEYIDAQVLRQAAEEALGFTYAETSAVYARGGRLTAEQRQLRERIDARMLALSRSGGAMVTLAGVLGLNEKTVDRALARARAVEVEPIIKEPAVTTRLSCFKCESMDARPVRRRFSTSPAEWVGTVNLCSPCHRAGFVRERGNPEYWRFRNAS